MASSIDEIKKITFDAWLYLSVQRVAWGVFMMFMDLDGQLLDLRLNELHLVVFYAY